MNVRALERMIGKPWRLGASGPDAFDCWGVTLTGALQIFGLKIPDLPECLNRMAEADRLARAALAGGHWHACDPAPGAVLAVYDARGRVGHAGLCLPGDAVLTASKELGVHVVPLWVVRAVEARAEAYTWRA